MSEMRVVAVDFDNTLVEHGEGGETVPVPGGAEALAALRAQGYWIVIHTCRIGIARRDGNLQYEIGLVEELLMTFGIPFDEIYLGEKMVADVYIDDRAVAFHGDWDAAVAQTKRLLG